jgi:hypothetical protein
MEQSFEFYVLGYTHIAQDKSKSFHTFHVDTGGKCDLIEGIQIQRPTMFFENEECALGYRANIIKHYQNNTLKQNMGLQLKHSQGAASDPNRSPTIYLPIYNKDVLLSDLKATPVKMTHSL